jgi:hypothetical protein
MKEQDIGTSNGRLGQITKTLNLIHPVSRGHDDAHRGCISHLKSVEIYCNVGECKISKEVFHLLNNKKKVKISLLQAM